MANWLTPKEAMEYLKVSKSTFYKLVREGRVVAYTLSGTDDKRYKQEDLDALLTPTQREEQSAQPE